jgi:hypothetical protein
MKEHEGKLVVLWLLNLVMKGHPSARLTICFREREHGILPEPLP